MYSTYMTDNLELVRVRVTGFANRKDAIVLFILSNLWLLLLVILDVLFISWAFFSEVLLILIISVNICNAVILYSIIFYFTFCFWPALALLQFGYVYAITLSSMLASFESERIGLACLRVAAQVILFTSYQSITLEYVFRRLPPAPAAPPLPNLQTIVEGTTSKKYSKTSSLRHQP
jgi:hypothetical protein